MNTPNKRALATSLVLVSLSPAALAATVTSDFSFGSGSPFGGTTTLGGVVVTLTSTETEPFVPAGFRDLLTVEPATVTFTFSKAIDLFSLDVTRVRADEFLTNFNIGDPNSLTGSIDFTPSGVGTLNAGDFNAGTLSWTGLNTTEITFEIQTPNATALALNSFSLEGAAEVPLPSSIAVLGLGLLGLGAVARVKRPNHPASRSAQPAKYRSSTITA